MTSELFAAERLIPMQPGIFSSIACPHFDEPPRFDGVATLVKTHYYPLQDWRFDFIQEKFEVNKPPGILAIWRKHGVRWAYCSLCKSFFYTSDMKIVKEYYSEEEIQRWPEFLAK